MPIVKHSWLVQDPREIGAVLKAAFHVARSERGPVLVDIPRDVQEAAVDFSYPETVDLPGWKPPAKVRPLQIREAARTIAHARKPVLYVGGTAQRRRLHGAPLARRGRVAARHHHADRQGAFPESHELHFGWPGMHGAVVETSR